MERRATCTRLCETPPQRRAAPGSRLLPAPGRVTGSAQAGGEDFTPHPEDGRGRPAVGRAGGDRNRTGDLAARSGTRDRGPRRGGPVVVHGAGQAAELSAVSQAIEFGPARRPRRPDAGEDRARGHARPSTSTIGAGSSRLGQPGHADGGRRPAETGHEHGGPAAQLAQIHKEHSRPARIRVIRRNLGLWCCWQHHLPAPGWNRAHAAPAEPAKVPRAVIPCPACREAWGPGRRNIVPKDAARKRPIRKHQHLTGLR